ncbi:MAG: putative toxin-antitoxin system toxin component, PIN family [Saprospiraceae bacterium]|nr:MAG: putative toxin-antitoxin system toxin component, PIN family [Saprospiraceae bacterium]
MLKVVLDTNVVLNALPTWSPCRIILDALFRGEYELYLSTEIYLEYEEKVREFYSPATVLWFLQALQMLPVVKHQEPHFRLNLIAKDPDDNKFVDCAFAAGVHYIVSYDKDFTPLRTLWGFQNSMSFGAKSLQECSGKRLQWVRKLHLVEFFFRRAERAGVFQLCKGNSQMYFSPSPEISLRLAPPRNSHRLPPRHPRKKRSSQKIPPRLINTSIVVGALVVPHRRPGHGKSRQLQPAAPR